jgi:hypothetical protein
MIVLSTGRRAKVERLAFAPDGRGLAAVAGSHLLYWADALGCGDPEPLREVRAHAGLGVAADGAVVVVADDQPALLGVSPDGWGTFRHKYTSDRPSFALTPDRTAAVVATAAGELRADLVLLAQLDRSGWVTDARRPVYAPPVVLGDRVLLFEESTDRGRTTWLTVRRLDDGEPVRSVPLPSLPYPHGTAADPLGRWAVLWAGNVVYVLDPDRPRRPLAELRNDSRKRFTGAAVHPSGGFLAVASNDATVKRFDAGSWRPAGAFTWAAGRMRSVAFSPDGTIAAAGTDDGEVVLWDVDV